MSNRWADVLKEKYGLEGTPALLHGEYDLNFEVQCTNGVKYLFKVMREDCDPAFVQRQCTLIEHLNKTCPTVAIPAIVPTSDGTLFAIADDENGNSRVIWLQNWAEGCVYADFNPKSTDLVYELGSQLAEMDNALSSLSVAEYHQDFKWNLPDGDWIADHLNVLNSSERRELISGILQEFSGLKPALDKLEKTVIHNDVNDYNILVDAKIGTPAKVTGIIDFGDVSSAPRVCEIAITGAYIILDHANPNQALQALVKGYHDVAPLTPEEINLIYPLAKLRLAVSVVNSTIEASKNPSDPYITISQAPAWAYLENATINSELMRARLRVACGMPVADETPQIMTYLDKHRGQFAEVLCENLSDVPTGSVSIEASVNPQNPFFMTESEALNLKPDHIPNGQTWIGHYAEPRLIYTDDAFKLGPWKASNRRTVHIGVDIFAEAGRAVQAPMDGKVEVLENLTGHLDYGGFVVLSHETDAGHVFYTLYGHLNPEVVDSLSLGQSVDKGEKFAKLGDASHNGGWEPHIHFQLLVTTKGLEGQWPGVADPDDQEIWEAICPNPAALLNIPDEKVAFTPIDYQATLADRRERFGENVKLSYEEPVMLLRGWKHHLFDEMGRPYLDAYNNVPHVGHAHPKIQQIAADQLKRMNSNTRYLHPAQIAFADKLLSKVPDDFSVCYFVNSGSEANELALRLARAHTGGKDMITPDHGYHGNTTGAIDISAYKFNKPNGVGQQDWVHLVDVADDYNGPFKREDPDVASKYANQVDGAIEAIEKGGGKLAGFIAETFPSVGGQIIPPKGYLASVYEKIRNAGGICIADEVQTGLGRLGEYYFGFEQQEVTPDIIVLGKPIGNGHPIGVVITTKAIAESFANGIEYFSTFGGSNLSCRTGKAVLDIVDEEKLQENAKITGGYLLKGLRRLVDKFEVVGDVRGYGLFTGVELVKNKESREPATDLAHHVMNRLRDYRILVGREGPHDNILKIRPPLTIEKEDVDMILTTLDLILNETACQNVV